MSQGARTQTSEGIPATRPAQGGPLYCSSFSAINRNQVHLRLVRPAVSQVRVGPREASFWQNLLEPSRRKWVARQREADSSPGDMGSTQSSGAEGCLLYSGSALRALRGWALWKPVLGTSWPQGRCSWSWGLPHQKPRCRCVSGQGSASPCTLFPTPTQVAVRPTLLPKTCANLSQQ